MIQKNDLLQRTGYKMQSTGPWTEIGPKPLRYGNTDFGGRIRQITYDPGDQTGNSIYIVGQGGGLWETNDFGLSWQNRSGDLPCLYGGTFAISYVNYNKILYFGTGDMNAFRGLGEGLGIFKSTNNGTNWIAINNGIEPITTINKIAVSPNDPNTLFAATFHGLYKTTNNGEFWVKIIPETDGVNLICSDICFSPDNGSHVYAVGPSGGNQPPWDYFDGIGYWRSEDGGNNFDPVQAIGFPHSTNLILSIICGVSKANNAEGYLWFNSFEAGNTEVYVYKSTDYGTNFTSYPIGDNSTSRYHLLLRPSDVNKNICFAGATNLRRTLDGGNSWDWPYAYHADYMSMDFNPFDPTGMKLMVGNDGGVFSSTDLGSSWSTCNQNLGSMTLLWSCASSTYDANFVAGGLHDYGQAYSQNSSTNYTTWTAVDFGLDGGNMTSSPFRSKQFACEKVYDRSFRYSPDGISYYDPDDYDKSTTYCPEYAPFTQHPTIPGVVFSVRSHNDNSGKTDLRKSINYGSNWGGNGNPFRTIQKPSTWGGVDINFISISPSSPNIMVMDYGQVYEFFQFIDNQNCRLIKSTDSGLTWEGIDYGDYPIVTGGQNGTPDRCFTDVQFDPKFENILYLTVSGYYYPSTNQGHVFRSIDGGYNWSNISNNLPSGNNLPDVPVNHLLVHYTGTGENDKELLIATDAGIYVSNATNLSWQLLGEGFPNTMAFHLDYNRLSGKLRANTWGRGAWEFQLDQNTIYVQDRLYITDNVTIDKPIVVAPGGKLILGHSDLLIPFTINFINNGINTGKIIVEDGGTILANTNTPITLTSTGTWPGIEVNGQSSNCLLYNCTFLNTATPVVINGGMVDGIPPVPEYGVILNDCHFSNVPVTVTNRNDVRIQYCDWINNTGQNGIIANGANGLYLLFNEINYTSQVTESHAIHVSMSDNVTITQSTISHCDYPITVSNGTYYIRYSNINTIYPTTSEAGIYIYGVNNGHLIANNVSGYKIGYYLDYQSSPTVLLNTGVSSNPNGEKSALYCLNNSSPRLYPTDDGGTLI